MSKIHDDLLRIGFKYLSNGVYRYNKYYYIDISVYENYINIYGKITLKFREVNIQLKRNEVTIDIIKDIFRILRYT